MLDCMTTALPSPYDVDGATAERWPRELQLLLGPEATEILAVAAEAAGARLRTWSPRQVNHQPGRSTVVQYRADVATPGGRPSTEMVVAATGDRIPDGAAVLDDGTTRVAMWRWPFDPSLPGLQHALDRDRVGALLDELGVGGGTLQLRVRAYRPGRRAVVEATGRRGRVFLKVVRPATVEALHGTHRMLARHLPVPDSVGWTSDGILVLPGLAGRTLRDVLRSGRAPAPEPATIDALLDDLPAALAAQPPRRTLVSAAAHHANVIASTMPSLRATVEDLVADLARSDTADHDLVAVHGDLYEAQLLVDNGRITGLLDVDTAGAGHRVDDLANFCAHLSVLVIASDRPRGLKRYGAALLEHAEARFDRADLRTRVAAAVISLATGPFRVLEPRWGQHTARRLDLARGWLDGAR